MFSFLLGAIPVLALDPSLDVSQYAHTAWTVRDGFSVGNIYAIAQTPDGYLWFGSEFGLFRFDGVHATSWDPPAGQQLPDRNINALLVSHDGTLWIGTFAGLVTLSGGKLSRPPAAANDFVASLFEDSSGTVWVGSLGDPGRLCAIRSGSAKCYGEDGAFGRAVWAFYEDSSGILWAGAQSGAWRINPGPLRRYPTPTELVGLNKADDDRLLIALHGAGLMRLVGDKLESYPIGRAINSARPLADRDVDSNRLLRDRDGGLWIGTVERGLIHVHQGRTDVFTKSDGLSGDVILSLFEDREGNIWVASTGGLDRFRELPVSTISVRQGLSSDATEAVLAATDGSVWLGAHDGLTRWRNGQTTIFRKANGLPDDAVQALFQDYRGRIWVSSAGGLAYLQDDKFLVASVMPGENVHYITGDKAGNLWLSENKGLLHLREGRLVEQIPWSALGRRPQANVVLSDGEQGVWLGFWVDGGVSYFKDNQLRASYTTADGLAKGPVPELRLDLDGALWVATEYGGMSRIKDGRIATLTIANGLPCNTINSTVEDDDRSLWLYTACGLVRITRAELDAWIAQPKHRIETTVWDAADGVRLRSSAASEYGPRVAKSNDGKLWFVTGEGFQVVDPHHLAMNKLPPPVHIEQVTADGKTYDVSDGLRLPPLVRNLAFDFVALSLVAPEKNRYRFKLEGWDRDWREAVNELRVEYSNLPPKHYKFRVLACNNSGVWNEEGAALDFVIPPAWYQTNWFRAACVAAFLAMVWGVYELRVRQLAAQFNMRLEERVAERTRVARDLHDTLLQSFQALLPSLQAGINMLAARPADARKVLEDTADHASQAIAEGRDAVQGLRMSTVEKNDLAVAIRTVGEELASDASTQPSPNFNVVVEGASRNLHPILRDEVYRLATEALRNAFRHAAAKNIEVEIRYDDKYFRLRIRDDGKGIPPDVLSGDGRQGHYGLPGMRERAKLVGGKLAIWTELDGGTEIELNIPGARAYVKSTRTFWHFGKRSATDTDEKEPIERE
jgi:signal transduction histidine kinase/ligand-binding sensor domain-containing protein